jgi:hypothetical protein
MSRLGTFGVAMLTGVFGMFVTGFIASLAVDWYNIPGREGESGYFVVMLALLGFAAGVVIGWLVARMARARGQGFIRALGASLGVVVAIGAVTGGLARAIADVPPALGGETMLLAVEVRWPETQTTVPAVVGADEPFVSLHSIPHFSHTVRASARGPLWMEDARRVGGRWVVPGAVEVFTSRGTRMLTVHTGEKDVQGFQVPLPAFPRAKDLTWSEWLPRFRAGVKAPANLLSYRYHVVKASQPIRTETIGPFDVATIANGFFEVQHDEHTLNGASAKFSVSYRGKPLIIDARINRTSDSTESIDRFDNVALLAGPRSAVLLTMGSFRGTGQCYVVVENGDSPRSSISPSVASRRSATGSRRTPRCSAPAARESRCEGESIERVTRSRDFFTLSRRYSIRGNSSYTDSTPIQRSATIHICRRSDCRLTSGARDLRNHERFASGAVRGRHGFHCQSHVYAADRSGADALHEARVA